MKAIFILLNFILLCGCTTSRFPVLDTVISGMSVSKIDQYFDLSPEQQKKLEEDVNSDLENLRRERFVKLAAALRAIDREAQHASRNENVLGNAYTVLQREYKMDSGQLSSSAKKLMVSLKREQILYFRTQVDKEIASDRAESVADKNRELVSRFRKVFKFFAGDLTPEQSNSITTFTQMKPFPWKQKIDNREQILVRFLKFQSQPEQRAKLVGQFMENYDSLCTPEYLREMTNYENEFKDFLNKFWTTMSSEQKVQLHLHLEDQAQELERLARGL